MPSDRQRRDVLIIDDDASQRALIKRILNVHKLNVYEAASGADALLSVRDSVPDLIILDMQMPEMDGPETLTRIREELGDASPPIVGLSGAPRDDAADLGFADYILKPFSIGLLRDRIRHYIDFPS